MRGFSRNSETQKENAMKERPILFKGEMVRAILEGRKTQTRRGVKQATETTTFWEHGGYQPRRMENGETWTFEDKQTGLYASTAPTFKCPYGTPGDRLWVRETFAVHPEDGSFLYRCDRGGDYQGAAQGDFKWKPSIFCTRRASRITLEIVKVRVERLQDITEADAKAEGAQRGLWCNDGVLCDPMDEEEEKRASFRNGYGFLWECINGPGSWALNPWVWVVEFKQVQTGNSRNSKTQEMKGDK